MQEEYYALYYAPEGSYALQWLRDNGIPCAACPSPEEMPQPEYVTEGDFEFLVFNGEAAFSAYLGTDPCYVIPSTAAGCPVTRVLSEGFDGPTAGGRDSVVVPASVEVLDQYSTHIWQGGKYVKHVYLANPQTIITSMFSGCTIHAPEGGLAEETAGKYNIPFEPWDGTTMPF